MASFLLLFLSLSRVCNIYGPLFIEFVIATSNEERFASIIFVNIVSLSSVPIGKTSSPIVISL